MSSDCQRVTFRSSVKIMGGRGSYDTNQLLLRIELDLLQFTYQHTSEPRCDLAGCPLYIGPLGQQKHLSGCYLLFNTIIPPKLRVFVLAPPPHVTRSMAQSVWNSTTPPPGWSTQVHLRTTSSVHALWLLPVCMKKEEGRVVQISKVQASDGAIGFSDGAVAVVTQSP